MNIDERFVKKNFWQPFESELMKYVDADMERRFSRTLKNFKIVDRQFEGKTFKMAYVISDELVNSEMLARYLVANPDVGVACQFNFSLGKASLRSRGKIDTCTFSMQYNGGGHVDASGHAIQDNLTKIVAEIIHDQNIPR